MRHCTSDKSALLMMRILHNHSLNRRAIIVENPKKLIASFPHTRLLRIDQKTLAVLVGERILLGRWINESMARFWPSILAFSNRESNLQTLLKHANIARQIDALLPLALTIEDIGKDDFASHSWVKIKHDEEAAERFFITLKTNLESYFKHARNEIGEDAVIGIHRAKISMDGEIIPPKIIISARDEVMDNAAWTRFKKDIGQFLLSHLHLTYQNYTGDESLSSLYDQGIRPKNLVKLTSHELMHISAFFKGITLPYL